MSEPQHISTVTHEMEARLLLQQEYDEENIEDIMDIYRDVVKHIGFEDKRSDERFIVKFHDILYYEPRELGEDARKRLDDLFAEFCDIQYDYVMYDLQMAGIKTNIILTYYTAGNYRKFELYIPYIAEDNVLDVTEKIWAEGLGCKYASDYVYTVNLLQDLEDNYMEYWIEFLKDSEFPDAYVKKIEDAYNKDNSNNNNQPQQPKEK